MLRKQKLLKFITNIMNVNFFQPKLTLAKCRKNVENFLEACRKLGVHRVSERTITNDNYISIKSNYEIHIAYLFYTVF